MKAFPEMAKDIVGNVELAQITRTEDQVRSDMPSQAQLLLELHNLESNGDSANRVEDIRRLE